MFACEKAIESKFLDLLKLFEGQLDFKAEKEEIDNTPKRLSKMYINELLSGYSEDPEYILSKTFKSKDNDMVIIRNIPFNSLCAHHWLPFIGTCDVGYIPKNNKIVGLSKIPRVIECFAKRFQTQENMTTEIADSIYDILKPEGCIVITNAKHLCAQIRGVQSKNTEMICSSVRGCFDKDGKVRNEFLNIRG